MHRIDGNGHVSIMVTEGTPGVTRATQVTDDWLKDVQEELADFIEAAGITLVKGSSQLLAALIAKLAAYTDQVNITGPADVDALTVTGTNLGSAIVATGGGSNGANQGAIEALAASGNGSGIVAQGNGSGVGLIAKNSGGSAKTVISAEGWISLNAANEPAYNATVGANRITPMNVCKGWVKFTMNGSGTVTIVNGFNITSVTLVMVGGGATPGFRVTFVDGFDSTSYFATSHVMTGSNGAGPGQLNRESQNAAYYEAGVWDLDTGAQFDPNASAYDVTVKVLFYGAS